MVEVAPFAAINSRGARQRRQQGLERGPDQRDSKPEQRSEGVDEDVGARHEGDRRSAEGGGSDQHHREEEAFARKPVAQRRGERGDDRRRQQADEPGDADG